MLLCIAKDKIKNWLQVTCVLLWDGTYSRSISTKNKKNPEPSCSVSINNHLNTDVTRQVTRCLEMMDEIDCLSPRLLYIVNASPFNLMTPSTGDVCWGSIRSRFSRTLSFLFLFFPVRSHPKRILSALDQEKRSRIPSRPRRDAGSCCSSWRATKWAQSIYIQHPAALSIFHSLVVAVDSMRCSLCR